MIRTQMSESILQLSKSSNTFQLAGIYIRFPAGPLPYLTVLKEILVGFPACWFARTPFFILRCLFFLEFRSLDLTSLWTSSMWCSNASCDAKLFVHCSHLTVLYCASSLAVLERAFPERVFSLTKAFLPT
ncbi:MAG: hypothetical protein HMLIMOIP_001634 [Candidatus Nitrosomirales archaeon]|jgi:hypothetical protein